MFHIKRHHTLKNTLIMTWKTLRDIFRPLRKVKGEPIEIHEDELRIWRIGHATILINFYGTTILTDPVFAKWIPYPRRITGLPYTVDDLPHINIVAVSHAHFDHLNKKTLKKLAHKSDMIILPRNCSDLIHRFGYKQVAELAWHACITHHDTTVTSIRPKHWGQRVPWEIRKKRSYNAYILEKRGRLVYFSGDSGYGEFYEHVGRNYDIDVALMGIGSYYPEPYLENHQSPEQAIDAALDLQAEHIIPMHYEDFRLTVVPIKEPITRLHKAAREKGVVDRLRILDNGESFVL